MESDKESDKVSSEIRQAREESAGVGRTAVPQKVSERRAKREERKRWETSPLDLMNDERR
jgi:hypothetical protein